MRLYPLAPAEPTSTTRTYPSSLSDAEWAVLQSLVQRPATPKGGRPPKHPLRAIVDAIRYLVRTGCAWRLLPSDFPPPSTVYWWFAKWAADGTLQRLHDVLRERVRVAAGRRPTPTAAIVDSQSVRAADTVPRHSRGWDAGKKVNGRKRHLAVDTMGLLLVVWVTAASVQDRDGARALLWRLRASSRRIRLVWADAGYAGKLVAWAQAVLHLVMEIVRKRPGQSTFHVLPRRWVVERTLAWISKHRRCVRDYERLPAHHADGHLGHGRGDDPTACSPASTTIHPDQRRITVVKHGWPRRRPWDACPARHHRLRWPLAAARWAPPWSTARPRSPHRVRVRPSSNRTRRRWVFGCLSLLEAGATPCMAAGTQARQRPGAQGGSTMTGGMKLPVFCRCSALSPSSRSTTLMLSIRRFILGGPP